MKLLPQVVKGGVHGGMGLGFQEHIEHARLGERAPGYPEADDAVKALKRALFPELPGDAAHGIAESPEKYRLAHEVRRVIEKSLAWEKQPEGGQKPGGLDQKNNQQQTPGAGQASEKPQTSPEAQQALSAHLARRSAKWFLIRR